MRHDQHFAVGIVEKPIGHRSIGGVDVNPMPTCVATSPLPPGVIMPSTKSVGCCGTAMGLQHNWLGVASRSLNGPLRIDPLSIRL
jgi:hypothetical protein